MTSFRNFDRIWASALLIVTVAGSACSSARRKPEAPPTSPPPGATTSYGPSMSPQAYGPEPSPAQNTVGPQPPADYGPQPEGVRPLVVVLGPGMARGFAHVGAIRALTDAHIPIAAVLGTEMGSFVGAAFGIDGKANRLDWFMTRIKPSDFRDGRTKESHFLGREDALTSDLKRAFGARDLARGKVPVRIGLEQPKNGETFVADQGSAAEAVRAALGDEAHPADWHGLKACSSSKKEPFLVSRGKALGLGPVLLIDTSESGSGESAGADLVIRPDLHGVSDDDFEKKSEISFRGKKAVTGKLNEIRVLAGLKKGSGS